MSIAIAVICVVFVALFVFKKNQKVEDSTSATNKPLPSQTNRNQEMRLHTKMDVPMIRSRFEKLNATDGLTEHAKKKLDKQKGKSYEVNVHHSTDMTTVIRNFNLDYKSLLQVKKTPFGTN